MHPTPIPAISVLLLFVSHLTRADPVYKAFPHYDPTRPPSPEELQEIRTTLPLLQSPTAPLTYSTPPSNPTTHLTFIKTYRGLDGTVLFLRDIRPSAFLDRCLQLDERRVKLGLEWPTERRASSVVVPDPVAASWVGWIWGRVRDLDEEMKVGMKAIGEKEQEEQRRKERFYNAAVRIFHDLLVGEIKRMPPNVVVHDVMKFCKALGEQFKTFEDRLREIQDQVTLRIWDGVR